MNYPDDFINKIICGDSLEVLKYIPDNTIDAIVTDPPYGLGFMGKKWDKEAITFNPVIWSECFRILKPGAFLISFGATRTYHRLASAIEDAGFEIKDMLEWIYFSGYPKSINVGKEVDKIQGNKRIVIGKNPNHRESDDLYKLEFQGGKGNGLVTKGFSEWEGWGTGLKPAHEPIVLARKPVEKGLTIAENCLKWNVGALNIEECRLPFEDTPNPATNPKYRLENDYKLPARGVKSKGAVNFTSSLNEINPEGRFPANVVVTDNALDFEIELLKDESYSRFFDIDAWFKKKGLFICPKASRKERDLGCENLPPKKEGFLKDKIRADGTYKEAITRNNHPTVKPIQLMCWLVALISKEGHIVLDPFIGSGTTAIACKILNRKYIGIELQKEYVEIALNRLKMYNNDLFSII